MIFLFDDGSTLDLPREFQSAFAEFDPRHLETLLIAAVDYFWETHQQFNRLGAVCPWEQEFGTKSSFARHMLGRMSEPPHFVDEISDPLASLGVKGLVVRAKKAIARSDWERAKKEAEASVFFDPENAEGWQIVGRIARALGNPHRARVAFKKSAGIEGSPYLNVVDCPACGWVPDGRPHWPCSKCDELFDAFAKTACARCGQLVASIRCQSCGAAAPYDVWSRR